MSNKVEATAKGSANAFGQSREERAKDFARSIIKFFDDNCLMLEDMDGAAEIYKTARAIRNGK